MLHVQFEILNLFRGTTGCMRSGVNTLQTKARRQQTTAFCSNCWLQLIPKHVTLHSAVHEHHGLFHIKNFIQFFFSVFI